VHHLKSSTGIVLLDFQYWCTDVVEGCKTLPNFIVLWLEYLIGQQELQKLVTLAFPHAIWSASSDQLNQLYNLWLNTLIVISLHLRLYPIERIERS
jgi:hypothetical protein